jgi:adenylate cyclase
VQPNTLVTKILELSREDPTSLQRLEAFRRAVTVMFTDIKGSTEYFEKYGDLAGLALVCECNDLLRRIVENHGGRVIKTIGDAVMAVFDGCAESVQAAVTMQRQLRTVNRVRKKEDEMLVRIGLHHGIGIVKTDDVFGDVVNVASRVESIAKPQQIVISDSLEREISPSKFDIAFLGRFRFKGKTEDRDIFQVQWSDTPVTQVHEAHTIVSHRTTRPAVLQRLAPDGSAIGEYPIPLRGITIGRTEGDVKFPEDARVSALHARFSLEQGQPMVEDVSGKGNIFIRLIATYTLQPGDVIAMGALLFKFISRPDLVAAATTLGRTLSNITELLNEPAAELLVINPGRKARYPLRQEEVRLGRTNGSYTFNEDPLMSRSHARIYHRGEDFFLEDLQSLNGTFVRVRRRAPVPFGAPVLVGREVLRVVSA